MPPFGRRATDPVADMVRSTEAASPSDVFSFATLEFSEIFVPHDGGRIQLRQIDSGRRVLGPTSPDGQPSFEALRSAILQAFEKSGEPDTAARFLTHEGVRLKIVSVDTVKGGLYICRQVRQTPAFTALEGIAEPIRAHLGLLDRTQQSGLLIISGPPSSGKTTTVLSIALHLTGLSDDVALVIGNQPEVRLDGIIQGSQGRIVQVRSVADPASYDNHLRGLLTLSPRFAAVASITSGLDARLALDLAMAGLLVVTTINANDIPGAIDNFINRARSNGGAQAARDAVALTLRGVMHQTLGGRAAGADLKLHRLNVTSLFLPGASGNQTMMRKIKDDKVQDLAADITFQDTRVRNHQSPLGDFELSRYDVNGG